MGPVMGFIINSYIIGLRRMATIEISRHHLSISLLNFYMEFDSNSNNRFVLYISTILY